MIKKILSFLTLIVLIEAVSTSNTFDNFNKNNKIISYLKTNDNDNQTCLFNNQYGYLTNNNWITNQSIIDNKFYSYDTSALKNYTFTNAKKTFLVDTKGNLVYNLEINVPDKDKSDIENTKQEMISHKKVTTIKDNYSQYSKSEYSNSYFVGNNWQYLQLGGFEKHIDISNQTGSDKVEHSNSLSETLGLYYIAKAAHENKIGKRIANNLAKYFILQSSLKEKINDKLITKIIDLIIDNKKIYNFILNNEKDKGKIINNCKNYSLNYIFDENNNLIKIYCIKFNDENITKHLDIKYNDWFSFNNYAVVDSDIFFILNWKKYTNNWKKFTEIYSTFNFDNKSIFKITVNDESKSNLSKFSTSDINFAGDIKTSNKFANTIVDDAQLWICFWRDENKIWFQYHFINSTGLTFYNTYLNIQLDNLIFNNIMN